MIPPGRKPFRVGLHSPRIRGDDPMHQPAFITFQHILPVFAGMIPPPAGLHDTTPYSPRIRGDDPVVPCSRGRIG